ncbi:Alpha-(1,6)-fucosyltransferase [Larimichthys crocea]|uniref:Uncharacterized protein n=1 Tax=Larimichthys crocea TaxID=215358 RepID=A0ACD3QZG0_LARCR|nr:Alpha-(1,6)-fucosyltransferase [Larimichthys crocea]
MRPWAGSWRWITLVLLAWGTLLFYIGGHLVRDSEHPERSSRELSKILAKLERLKQQNEDLRRMAESLRIPEGQAEAGSLAAGRLRSLEDQLTRAKAEDPQLPETHWRWPRAHSGGAAEEGGERR